MQPVAGRTRRRCDQDLNRRWKALKNPNSSSSGDTDESALSPLMSLSSNSSRSVASLSSDSDTMSLSNAPPSNLKHQVEEEVAMRGSYDAIPNVREVVEEDEDVMILAVNPVIAPPLSIVVVSSSNETEKEDMVSSSSSSGGGSEDFDVAGMEDEKEEEEVNGEGNSKSEDDDEEKKNGESSTGDECEEVKQGVGAREAKMSSVSVESESSQKVKKKSTVAKRTRSKWSSVSQKLKVSGSIARPIVLDCYGDSDDHADDADDEDDEDDEDDDDDDEVVVAARSGGKRKKVVVDAQSRGQKKAVVNDQRRGRKKVVDGAQRCAKKKAIDDAERCARRKVVDVARRKVEEEEEDSDDDDDDDVVEEEDSDDSDDDDDDDGDEEEEEDEMEESNVGNVVEKIVKEVLHPNENGKSRPLTAHEIHHVLFNSIMEDGNSDEVEKPIKPHGIQDVATTSSSDVDSDTGTDKSDHSELEIDSIYKMLNFCLACGDDNDAANLIDEDQVLGTSKNQVQLCNEGKHYLILDEEIGIICKACGIVREEIKHVTAPFHTSLFGVSERSEYYSNNHRNTGGLLHFEDPNCERQHYEDDSKFDPTGTVWEIIPGLRRTLLPHQREAFEFLWRNVAGGTKLDELNDKNDGGGCLISHAPGTGKTRLAIAFLETYMKFHKKCRPVIIAPASILLTWKKEFKKWKVGIPFLNMNDDELCMEEIAMARSLYKIESVKKLTPMDKRMVKLMFWSKHQSVLAVSYTLFSQLAGGDTVKKRGRAKKSGASFKSFDQSEMIRKTLIELPGLLILDEGHMPRNDKSSMFKVLSVVETKKRFILSGTPFQNNFRELYNILCLVMPELIKDKNPFNFFVDKADEGKIRELKANMKLFSHCYDGYVVSAMVPGLIDNIIYLEPSVEQKRLLNEFKRGKNHFEANVDENLISVHPLLFQHKCSNSNVEFAQELRRWDLADGAKTIFVKRLIELSSALGERVLVFSEYIKPLNFVKAVLECSELGWKLGCEILVMSGEQDMDTRKRAMDFFNKTGSPAKVMLASTKACSEGIELTGASRVVLLDVSWNPAVERQAISRAYRIGQQKVVHVYHLIMTLNDNSRHDTQTQKNRFSKYVFSSRKKDVVVPASSEEDFDDIILERLLQEKVIKDAVQQKKSDAALLNESN